MTGPIVYLMRGLPSTGKSTTARRLAGETGAVFETDSFFLTEIGDDPTSYDYDRNRLTEARNWNYERFKQAVNQGISPIIVDRGNSLSMETKRYAVYAIDAGYRVELAEPDSTWWQEIRVLLKYKRVTGVVLVAWAKQLAKLSRITHRVPVRDILRQMSHWQYDLTVEDILGYEPSASPGADNAEATPRPVAGRVTAVSRERRGPDAVIAAMRDADVAVAVRDGSEGAADSGMDAWTFDEGEDVFVPLAQSGREPSWPEAGNPLAGGATARDIDGDLWVFPHAADAAGSHPGEECEDDTASDDLSTRRAGQTKP